MPVAPKQLFIQMSGAPDSGKSNMAQKAGGAYGYIECVVTDLAMLDARLRARPKLPSQVTAVYQSITNSDGKQWSGESLFAEWIAHMKRPQTPYLTLDTTQPIAICLEKAMAYLQTIQSL